MTTRKQHTREVKIEIPEVKVQFHKTVNNYNPNQISSSSDAAKLFRSLYEDGEIELHECMFVLFLDRANQPIGYYKHSVGGINSTIVDERIILATAIKCLASAIIMAHNHPSGNIKPSYSDIKLTKRLLENAEKLDIALLDSLIITKNCLVLK